MNQNKFRNKLLKKYETCCLCQVHNKEILIASHIKPWNVSEKIEKLDSDNGFLMCPNHDKLFDKGLISFTEEGKILISSQLDDTDRMFLNVGEDMKINLTDGNQGYLKYHRDYIFRK